MTVDAARASIAAVGAGRLAVRVPNWLGDAMFALPTLREVRRLAPRACLELHAREGIAAVLEALDGVGDRIVRASRPTPAGLFADARRLRGADVCLLLPNSFGSALPAALARVPVRIGAATAGRAPLLSHAVPAVRGLHLVAHYRRLVGAEGALEIDDASASVRPAVRSRVKELIGEAPYAALVPGAAYGPAKRWGGPSFAAVGRELAGRGLEPVVLGTLEEVELAAAIAGACDGRSLAGRTSGAELAAVLQGARVVVANDSGAAHLTAALGTPLVVIYGATDPVATGPATGRHQILYHPAECSPCGRRRCARPTHECMDATSPGEVLEAIERVMAGPSRQSAM